MEADTRDRWNVNFSFSKNFEYLKAKYIGTGDATTTRAQWATEIQRDTYSSLIQHDALLSYISIANGESKNKTKFEMLEKMVKS